jgi:hypothetical protein
MRAGQFAVLEMMLPYPRDWLDQPMAEVLVHARAMAFQSLDLEVSASVSQAKQAFEARLCLCGSTGSAFRAQSTRF